MEIDRETFEACSRLIVPVFCVGSLIGNALGSFAYRFIADMCNSFIVVFKHLKDRKGCKNEKET